MTWVTTLEEQYVVLLLGKSSGQVLPSVHFDQRYRPRNSSPSTISISHSIAPFAMGTFSDAQASDIAGSKREQKAAPAITTKGSRTVAQHSPLVDWPFPAAKHPRRSIID
ncbi:hypothetical protein M427DRAFT_74907 [Gonapodya prolifera JEL478]|uniref:Uncharacterized protein n=1 Tax=Gonapodya prolifera (strain JEL478) TaxID=1344416 RepID=A0A139A0F2_GONPJ|nr:hypothetical protein M427DRAFT_74907 [Gonapodya prolifera JEL478]|eukprot:KXS09843.1 hypothetical protein M427DRAFT_74907 [Gonapodya prolifera JEL478]